MGRKRTSLRLVSISLVGLSSALLLPASAAARAKVVKASPPKPTSPSPAPAKAPAPSSYEELLQSADQLAPATTSASQPERAPPEHASFTEAAPLGTLIEPLFASCSKDSDLAFRQCETIREWHLERMHHRSFSVTADRAALSSSPYDPTEKTVTLTVTGCISCVKPPAVDGAPRLIATRPPKGFAEGAPVGIDVGFHEVPIATAKGAQKWQAKILPRLRVEYVFTVGEPFENGAMHGVTVVPMGHRVYDSCTGEVVASEPVSKGPKSLAAKDPSCPASDAPSDEEVAERAEQEQLPDTLAREDIERSLVSVQKDVDECAQVLELKGTAKVSLVLSGDGKHEMKIASPYDKGEAGVCLRKALRKASFPKFKKGRKIPFDYPFVLHP